MSDTGTTLSKISQINIPKTFQRVLSRTITGPTSPQNKYCVDWGWQGFLAYGTQNTVVVIDPRTLQCAQTLSKHRSHVVKVRWRKTLHYHHLSAPYSLVLASSDLTGVIYIWNVAQAEATATLQDGSRCISEMEWLGKRDGSEHLLAALHPPYSLVIWDTRHSSKVWKKSYTEILQSFTFDPFHMDKMAFLCQGCILFCDDFNTQKCPSSNGNRFFISSPTSPNKPATVTEERSIISIRKRVQELVVGETKPRVEDPCQISECIQLLYHHAVHNQLILVYSREILLIDLEINQTVGIIPFDRISSPIVQVISCRQRDAIFCLHESGSVTCHFRRPLERKGGEPQIGNDDDLCSTELLYERKCYSEALRLNKNNRPIGFAINPASEKHFALILGDGRTIFKEIISASRLAYNNCISQSLNSSFQKSDQLKITDNHFGDGNEDIFKLPHMSLSQLVKSPYEKSEKEDAVLRLMVMGLIPSLSSPPLVIRMCPPLTTKNLQEYVPFMAVGVSTGAVQIFNLATGVLEKEFSVHTYPVKGIEWTSLTSFLSYAYQPLTNTQGMVRNELVHTDSRTGFTLQLRTREMEESPIEMIRISYLKQYFILVFKDDPFELWDCQTLSPLRTMSRRFPKITAFEWSPTTHIKSRKESLTLTDAKKAEKEAADIISSMSESLSSSSLSIQSPTEENPLIKETMVFTDMEGQLYQFSVKGNIIKHVTKIPPDSQRNTITSIAFKSNEIVLSDSDGTIVIWDLKARVFRAINTHRGVIKKMRFAPGKDNMKLLILYNDGVDIWDIRTVLLISQVKCPKDMAKILDIDWGASDSPILATIDGCLRVMDIQLKKCNSPINQYYTKEPIVSPYLLSGEGAFNLRTLMTHQPWREQYSLNFSIDDGFTPEQLSDIKIWLSHLQPGIRNFLETCNSIALRSLVTAFLFGDEGDLYFWIVATHYLTLLSRCPNAISKKDKLVDVPVDDDQEAIVANKWNEFSPSLLDMSFYHLCANPIYKNHELNRLLTQETKDLKGPLRDTLGRKLAVIGERDRVVRLLLDGDSTENQFYSDCLRACLLSATHHSTQAQSTIKLVATNLIAAGNIWEGTELLCMIGKALDACRYLQSYNYWNDSVWLAKCASLSPSDTSDIFKRWAGHLVASGYKDLGVCAYLAAGVLSSALGQLSQQNYHQRAALLYQSAEQLMLPVDSNRGFAFVDNYSSLSNSSSSSDLFENLFRKYVYYLFGVGNEKAFNYFCQRLGTVGKEILKEFEARRS